MTIIAFPAFNAPELTRVAGSKSTISTSTKRLFPGDDAWSRLARELADRQALSIKEVFESIEFYVRVADRLRASRVADLFCGHGLVGLLFAAAGSDTLLMDKRVPTARNLALQAVEAVWPGTRDRVRYESRVRDLASGTAVVAVHACGPRSDQAIAAAVACGGDVAVMPCCYPNDAPGPPAVRHALGRELAWDVHRTYQLEAKGYKVRWDAIPDAITPMNRILVGRRVDAG